MKCARCSTDLEPGSSHANAEACVEALLAITQSVKHCAKCGGKVGCLPCSIKSLAGREIKKRMPPEIAQGLGLLGKILETEKQETEEQ